MIIRKLVHFLLSLFTGDREFTWLNPDGTVFDGFRRNKK